MAGEPVHYIGWGDVAEAIDYCRSVQRVAVTMRLETAKRGRKGEVVMRLLLSVSPLPGCLAGAFERRSTYADYPAYTKQTMPAWIHSALHTLLLGLPLAD